MAVLSTVLWLTGICTPLALGALTLARKSDNDVPSDPDLAQHAFDEERARDARVHSFNGRYSR